MNPLQACNLIIVRVFSKLQQELELKKTLNLARGFYPSMGKNEAPSKEKRIDPSFQVQRKCRDGFIKSVVMTKITEVKLIWV